MGWSERGRVGWSEGGGMGWSEGGGWDGVREGDGME